MVLLAVAFWILIVFFVIGVISYVVQIAKDNLSSLFGLYIRRKSRIYQK